MTELEKIIKLGDWMWDRRLIQESYPPIDFTTGKGIQRWTWVNKKTNEDVFSQILYSRTIISPLKIWNPFTSIKDAWMLVNKLMENKDTEWDIAITNKSAREDEPFMFHIGKENKFKPIYTYSKNNIMEVICEAVLIYINENS